MGLLSIYTATSLQENESMDGEGQRRGSGGYGCILLYRDQEGRQYRRELMQGYKDTTANRLALYAAIHGLSAVNRPCRIDLYSPSKYLTDAFNRKWIDKWLSNNWYRESSGPVRNVDLWEKLLLAMDVHDIHFSYNRNNCEAPVMDIAWDMRHPEETESEVLLRCRQLAETAAKGILLQDEGQPS